MFSGLRFRLLLLVLMTCAPLVALTLHTAWEDRRREVMNLQLRASRLVEPAKEDEAALIEDAESLLFAMSLSDDANGRNGVDASRASLERRLSDPDDNNRRYSNLGLLSTNGELLASCFPLPFGEELGHTRFFREVLEKKALAIGEITRPEPGRAIVHFGYPVRDSKGDLSGVLFAELDLKLLEADTLAVPTQLNRGSTWTVVTTKGLIVSRFPEPEEWVGRLHPNTGLIRAAFTERPAELDQETAKSQITATNTNENRHGIDKGVFRTHGKRGQETIHAFVPVESRLATGPVAGILSVPGRILFAQADRTLRRNLTWLALAASLAVVLGWVGSNYLIVRPVNALVRTSARLASGDLRSRTGLPYGRDELGQLTLSFDRMAEALEQREVESQRANHKLQVLSHRLVEVQECERRTIARELHDEIGQTLTAAEMNLQAALQSPRAASLERRLEESIQAVERVLEQVHDLSLNLRPSMLDDLGLEPALRWYTHRQADLGGLRAEFRPVPLEERPHPVVETECFRIAQEALNNVLKHAKAKSVLVELSKANHRLHLTVSDDGVGFEVNEVRDRAVRGESLGVLSMEERAALAGGGLKIESEVGRGTTVRAWFDLRTRFDLARAELEPVNNYGND